MAPAAAILITTLTPSQGAQAGMSINLGQGAFAELAKCEKSLLVFSSGREGNLSALLEPVACCPLLISRAYRALI